LDLRLFGIQPFLKTSIGRFLIEGSFVYTTLQVLFIKHTCVGKDRPGSVSRLSTFVYPIQRPVEIQINGSWVGVGVVGADALNKFTITWCARICYNYVVKRLAFLTVSLQSDFSCHSFLNKIMYPT